MWSVDNPGKAEIDPATGKLVPLSNGTVTIRATSAYNPLVYDEFEVDISNQGEIVRIKYMPGTQDVVDNMPGDSIGTGTVVLSTQVPVREGYQFVGWATDDESSPLGERYIFFNNGYCYEYSHSWMRGESIDELYVYDPNEMIIYYGEFTPVRHP